MAKQVKVYFKSSRECGYGYYCFRSDSRWCGDLCRKAELLKKAKAARQANKKPQKKPGKQTEHLTNDVSIV